MVTKAQLAAELDALKKAADRPDAKTQQNPPEESEKTALPHEWSDLLDPETLTSLLHQLSDEAGELVREKPMLALAAAFAAGFAAGRMSCHRPGGRG